MHLGPRKFEGKFETEGGDPRNHGGRQSTEVSHLCARKRRFCARNQRFCSGFAAVLRPVSRPSRRFGEKPFSRKGLRVARFCIMRRRKCLMVCTRRSPGNSRRCRENRRNSENSTTLPAARLPSRPAVTRSPPRERPREGNPRQFSGGAAGALLRADLSPDFSN